MFSKYRQGAKSFLYLGLVFSAVKWAAVAALALIGLVWAIATEHYEHVPGLLFVLVAIGTVFWFAAWVSRDSQRTTLELRRQRRRRRSNTGEVVGIPENPPWLG
jgi:cytochrome c biogenesis protein CcdA